MRTILTLLTALIFIATAHADNHSNKPENEELNTLITQVKNAYGGDVLVSLTGYRVSERYLTLRVGQSHAPDLIDIADSSQVLNYDIANNRSSYDTWFNGRDGGFQNSIISDGKKGITVNHQSQRTGEAGSADPYVFAGGTMRTADVLLVRELINHAGKATLGEDQVFQNRNHHVIKLPFPSSSELNLFIDTQTFLLAKMTRHNPQLGALDYVFSDYQQDNGITYAANTLFSIAGMPNLISQQRKIVFNPQFEDALFDSPSNYKAENERIDVSTMGATKISDSVYHVGQGNAFSLFVDTGQSIVAAGGYSGLANRLTHYRSASNRYKPLGYQVVTHHHSDHIGGLAEASGAGAKLITVPANFETITDGINLTNAEGAMLGMSGRLTLGEGRNRVELYEVSTSHSAGYIVMYVPANKLIFIADHLGSPFASGTPVATQGTVTMLAALDQLDIDIDRIATAHGKRIFTMGEMRDSVAAYKPNTCDGNRPVCELAE